MLKYIAVHVPLTLPPTVTVYCMLTLTHFLERLCLMSGEDLDATGQKPIFCGENSTDENKTNTCYK